MLLNADLVWVAGVCMRFAVLGVFEVVAATGF